MAPFEQPNNPFSLLNKKIKEFEKKHSEWKTERAEAPQKKYGRFSEGEKTYRSEKRAGESKFQFDVRKRKEDYKRRKNDPLKDASELHGSKTEPVTKKETEYIPIDIGTGHTSSDWTVKGSDDRSLQDLVDLRDTLDKNSAEYADEYARIQAAINAAYGNKEEDDLRIESEYTDIDVSQTDIDLDGILDVYQGTTSYHSKDTDLSKLYPKTKTKTKTKGKGLRFPEVGPYAFENSASYKGQNPKYPLP